MLELNVVLRQESDIMNKFVVNVPKNDSVNGLKKIICKKTYLQEDTMTIIYGSLCLQDNDPLCAYNIKNGVTIYVFKKHNGLDVHDLFNISVAFQALRMSRQYLHIWNNLKVMPMSMYDVMLKVPELRKDETAQILLKFPNKLRQFNTTHSINHLMKKHPSLIPAVLTFSEQVFKKIQDHMLVTSYSKHDQNEHSDDDIIHDSLEFAVPREMTPFASETGTASQLASQNRWAGQKQTSTSGNLVLSRRYLFSNVARRMLTPEEMDLRAKLQRMNNLGMMNDIRNAAALKLANCFETAIDIVRKRKGSPYTSYGPLTYLEED